MRRILATLAVVGALLFSAGSAWEAEAGEYQNLGSGNKSCGKWTEDSTEDGLGVIVNTAWVLGYITAFNSWGPLEELPGLSDISKGTDAGGLSAWIDNYCKAKPLDNIANAAEALIGELIDRKAN